MHDKIHTKTMLTLSLANGKNKQIRKTENCVLHLLFNLLQAFPALIIALASVLLWYPVEPTNAECSKQAQTGLVGPPFRSPLQGGLNGLGARGGGTKVV